jgi:hypothetical protein
VFEALEGAPNGLLHLGSARDELGVLGPGGDGDDEAVLVADCDSIVVDPPGLLAERLGLAGEGFVSVARDGRVQRESER